MRTQQYCLDGVLLGAATELEAALKTASTLDAAIEVHMAFLRAAKEKCFLTPSLLTRRCASTTLNTNLAAIALEPSRLSGFQPKHLESPSGFHS